MTRPCDKARARIYFGSYSEMVSELSIKTNTTLSYCSFNEIHYTN